jgi:hypothetical protein
MITAAPADPAADRRVHRAKEYVAPLAMWALWRLAHFVAERMVGGRPKDLWWDDGYYHTILRHGYERFEPYGVWQQTNFFPLLPWITRATQVVVRSETVAMHAVLTAAQLATVVLLYELGKRFYDRGIALGAVALLLLSPASVFLWMYFSEGLFLALSMGAILAAERRRPFLAGLLGAGVAATRSIGVLMVVPLALAQLRRQRPDRRLAYALLPVLGLLAVMAAQWIQAGDPLAFMKVSKHWGRETTLPFTTMFQRLDLAIETGFGLTTVLDFAAVGLAVWLAVRAWRTKMPWSMQAITWIAILTPLASGLAFSWLRYLMVAWPLYFVAADWLRQRPRIVWVVVALGLAVLSAQRLVAWNNGYFIG